MQYLKSTKYIEVDLAIVLKFKGLQEFDIFYCLAR